MSPHTIGSRIRVFREEREMDLPTLAQHTGWPKRIWKSWKTMPSTLVSAPCKRWLVLWACVWAPF